MSVQTKPGDVVPSNEVTLFIDGIQVSVPKGTMAIRAAEKLGIAIPRFCDHPLLDPQGACRECMVEVPDAGNGRGFPKPQTSCTLEVAPNMQIKTQNTSPVAAKAQSGILEFLLINHPLDCPICDKGGECPLQNQAMSNGRGETRYEGVKRTFPKPVSISAQILLDRERCVLCARCTRFSEQISGDPFIALVERGALQQVGMYADQPYDSYFSGNVIQICPVGALTSTDYRFVSRPFDLVSTPVTCEHCAAGCQLRTDHRHYQVKRRLAGDAPEVNEEWSCDVGRFAFRSGHLDDRLATPLVRKDDVLVPASWAEAIDVAVAGLKKAGSAVGVLTGGRLTMEDAYGYAKFTRAVLGTNDIDCRARVASTEEADFLAAEVAGRRLGDGVTYGDLGAASKVILVGFEPEEESPIVFLRLRKAVRKKRLQVTAVAPYLSNGGKKLSATLVPCAPGGEAAALAGVDADAGTIVLVGERAAAFVGLLSAVTDFAAKAGARLAWIPRRAGERGAIEAGCLPNLLPGGREVGEGTARVDVAAHWGSGSLPSAPGRDGRSILAAAATGELKALIVAGVELADLPDVAGATAAIEEAPFVISIEQRTSEVTSRADVVFPVALIEEKAGTFLNWEHRPGRVTRVNRQAASPMTDLRVLAALADALGTSLGIRTPKEALTELESLGAWEGARAAAPTVPVAQQLPPEQGAFRIASWRQLIDGSRGNDGALDLLVTAKPAVARINAAAAEALGVTGGDPITIFGVDGDRVLPVVVEPGMVDSVVWLPGDLGVLGIKPGDVVRLTAGGVA